MSLDLQRPMDGTGSQALELACTQAAKALLEEVG
jgi:hypothetical protein